MTLFNTEQMPVRLNYPPHFVWVAFNKEVHGPRLAGVFLYFEQKRLGIHGGGECVREWSQMEFTFGIHKVQNLRPAKQVSGRPHGRSIGREEFGKQGNEEKECEKRRAYQGQSVLSE